MEMVSECWRCDAACTKYSLLCYFLQSIFACANVRNVRTGIATASSVVKGFESSTSWLYRPKVWRSVCILSSVLNARDVCVPKEPVLNGKTDRHIRNVTTPGYMSIRVRNILTLRFHLNCIRDNAKCQRVFSLVYAFMQSNIEETTVAGNGGNDDYVDGGGGGVKQSVYIYTIWMRFKSCCARHFFLIFMHSHSEHKTHLIWQTTTVSGSSQKHPVPLTSTQSIQGIHGSDLRQRCRVICACHRQQSATNEIGERKKKKNGFFLLRRSLAVVTETNRFVFDAQAGRSRWKTKLK